MLFNEKGVYFSIGVMKKRLLILSTVISSLALSGCSFFSIIMDTSSTPATPWTGEKQKLTYTQEDLTDNHYYAIDTMPTTGNPKLLVLPIAFSDTEEFISDEERGVISNNLKSVAFGDGEDTGWYSIASYYNAESYGACNIEGEVADWYESGKKYDSVNSSEDTANIIKAAVNDWKAKNPTKIKDFDSDENGYIDGILAVYGGPNYKSDDLKGHRKNTNMWAYTSWLETTANTANPNPNTFIWASYDFMTPDLESGLLIDGHTYIHEMGHVFGLDDYYDYADVDDVWAGGFSMQDYNVGGHDPYSVISLGWADPYVPTSSTTITIKPFESSGDVILLSPNFSSNSAYDEYILLEYYSPTGVNEFDSEYQYNSKYPLGPKVPGIRIWHVDARLLKINESTRRGKQVSSYTIVNTIDENDGTYLVGCTNTTYTANKDTNAYCSVAAELRNFRILELIRKGDYTGSKTDEYLSSSNLFKAGDTFSLNQYAGCFPNGTRLDNGSRCNWNVKIDSINATEAKITVTI